MKSIDCAVVFKALADENRVDIVRFVARHPGVTASALLDRLDIAQSTLSHHMKVLVGAGVINVKRKGKWTHYSINVETIDRLERFMNGLRSARSLKGRRTRVAQETPEQEPTVIRMGDEFTATAREAMEYASEE